MKINMLLADHAEVAGGKLFVSGGGWTIIGPDPTPFAIAMNIEVPWDGANEKHTIALELLDTDWVPVTVTDDKGNEHPLRFDLPPFEVGRPPGVKPGTPLGVPLAVNFSPPPPIPPGGQYLWQLSIDGRADENWRLHFATRPAGGQALAA